MKVTVENLEEARSYCTARDQAEELEPGCETWAIHYAGGQRGQMSRWPNGRGAIYLGGPSEWGDWEMIGGHAYLRLDVDLSLIYDCTGRLVDSPHD